MLGDWGSAAKEIPGVHVHLETTNSFDDEITWKPEWFEFYEKVADVDATDLEETFHLTNLWHKPELIHKVKEMHSVSVGDILLKDGEYHMVAGCGFQQIEV